MKRVNEFAEGGSSNLGIKKVRPFSGIDGSSGPLDSYEVEEEGVFVQNGGVDSAQVDKAGDRFGNIVTDNLDGGPSLGGLEGANIWDFDINFDLIFGDEKQQKAVAFDLNLPVYRGQDGGVEKGSLGSTQVPMINENKVVEIIDIASDDSDDEVEIIGCTYGYNEKGKQMELGMPYGLMMENLSLGLGTIEMDNVGCGSSLVTGGERRYTREEKGKAYVDDDLRLSLKPLFPDDFDVHTINSAESIRIIEPVEDIEDEIWQPVGFDARDDLALRNLRRAEQAIRNRDELNQSAKRETARRFARVNFPDKNNGNESSSQKQPPTSRAVEQLGLSPGPFSEALKVVRVRIPKRTGQQLIEWKPSHENQDRSITAPFVPSLLDLSLRVLAENAEGIVSLEVVPDNLRGRLIGLLCDKRKMNVDILKLLVEGCPTEIRIKNCSWLTEDNYRQTFENCQTKDLRVLQLDLCGQLMLDFAFRATIAKSSDSFSKLAIVSLRGACRLSDGGLKDLLVSAPSVRSINLGQCTLLTSDAINFIASSLGSNLRELYIDDCQKINAMLTIPAFKKFKYLEVLSVAGISTITDQFIIEIITVCGRSVKDLDLANCLHLTDYCLKAIGGSCAGLCSLNISNLHKLTDLGLEFLANGCKSIQKLKLSRNEFSDEAMAAFVECSGESLTELLLNNMREVGPNTALSIAQHSKKLLSLDISSCRRITNEALGLIVDGCSSLKLLKVFGCRQITSVFVNGHSNPDVRIIGLSLTPLFDHLNLLEPEEQVLLRYSALPTSMEE